ERGQITFAGVVDNPRLDVLAIRPGESDVRVGVAVTGTAQAPRIKLYSDPDLPDTSKLSWLLLGRAPDTLQGADAALLQSAALALLSGSGESVTG
ncbi:translocation/assembly module TamB domain-containing protein, partial [Roseateles sp. GG27B]